MHAHRGPQRALPGAAARTNRPTALGVEEESQLDLKSRGGAWGDSQAGAARHPTSIHPQGGDRAEVAGREELCLAGCTAGQQHCSARHAVRTLTMNGKPRQDAGPNHPRLETAVTEMTKEKAACELELKANPETARARPAERREAGGVYHQQWKGRKSQNQAPNTPQQGRTPLGPADGDHVGTLTQRHRPPGFPKELGSCSQPGTRPNEACRPSLARGPPVHKP